MSGFVALADVQELDCETSEIQDVGVCPVRLEQRNDMGVVLGLTAIEQVPLCVVEQPTAVSV